MVMRDVDIDQQLQTLLSSESDWVADDGFTERVLAAVPQRPIWRWPRIGRTWIVPGMTLAGSLLGLIVLPGGDWLQALLAQLPHTQGFQHWPVAWLILVYASCWAVVSSLVDSSAEFLRPAPGSAHTPRLADSTKAANTRTGSHPKSRRTFSNPS